MLKIKIYSYFSKKMFVFHEKYHGNTKYLYRFPKSMLLKKNLGC